MNHSMTFSETVIISILAAFIPAFITGCIGYILARSKAKQDFQQWVRQEHSQAEHYIDTLQQQYINPLRYWAAALSKRLSELEEKLKNNSYGQVATWFQQIKDHADKSNIMTAFPLWCCYEGIFAMTTLYFTCSYLQSARQIRFRAPFREIDPDYDHRLQEHLASVGEAFGRSEGIWDSSQEVIGERFTSSVGKLEFRELSKILDSHDGFEFTVLLRPIDYYVGHMNTERTKDIGAALTALLDFVNSRPTPELRS